MTIRRRALIPVLAIAASALAVSACEGGDDNVGSDVEFDTEGPALQYDEYEVLFTNPVCKSYPYDQEVRSISGGELTAKPTGAFCTYDDGDASGERESSPQNKLVRWIEDEDTTEIFMTYLSFSNRTVARALCAAVERDVKVTVVLDSGTNTSRADELMQCEPQNPENAPVFHKRGHVEGVGYAHNKLFMVNPGAETMKLAFSSGNMSSGAVLHHENWHFITLSSETYFAQAHLCLRTAEIDHADSKTVYRDYLESCLDGIEYKQERDIQAYFVPADRYAASDRLLEAVYDAWGIDIAAHRFTYSKLMYALKYDLDNYDMPVRLIADDDMYWAGHGDQVGDNMAFEYYNAESLTDRGGQVKWMETNHESHLLHHNKFLIFDFNGYKPDAVWCGAGNLTGTGFGKNWENFYYVTIPHVVEAFRAQYKHMWEDLATAPEDMPTEDVMPAMD